MRQLSAYFNKISTIEAQNVFEKILLTVSRQYWNNLKQHAGVSFFNKNYKTKELFLAFINLYLTHNHNDMTLLFPCQSKDNQYESDLYLKKKIIQPANLNHASSYIYTE